MLVCLITVPPTCQVLRDLPGLSPFVEAYEWSAQMICQDVGNAGLVVCTAIDPEKKERLLVGLVQVGIDYWGVVKSGHPGWGAWGGHGSGRKFPIVFAGALLGDEEMANVGSRFPKTAFGEDEQTAYGDCFSGAKVVFTGHSGIDEATGVGRDYVRQGNPWGPYEHKNPSKWDSEEYRSEAYRRANTSACWVAEALVVRIMHLEKGWNHDAFFDYVDRWMNEDDGPVPVEVGARTPLYLATSEAVASITGRYFMDCEPVAPSALALDEDAARRLWEVSEELVACALGAGG